MNISIVIPNYNGEALLKENLPKILDIVKDYKHGRVEIIVPDDPSPDKSEEVIKAFIAGIKEKYVVGKTCSNKDPKKSGFSKNVNRGVKLATGEILILLNSDVLPHKGFLEPLLEHFSDEKVFAVACLDESVEEKGIVLRGRGVGYWKRGFLHHKEGKLDKPKTLWASGGSSAFRKSIWDKIGGLEELYNPFYWEDIDLSYRAWKCRYTVLFEPKSRVIHEHDKGAIKSTVTSSKVIRTAYRNQFTFVWLNVTDSNLLVSHFLWLPYHLVSAVMRRDWLFLKAFGDAVTRVGEVVIVRKRYGRFFVKKDKEILRDLKS